mgnify:CR=1 FL=1
MGGHALPKCKVDGGEDVGAFVVGVLALELDVVEEANGTLPHATKEVDGSWEEGEAGRVAGFFVLLYFCLLCHLHLPEGVAEWGEGRGLVGEEEGGADGEVDGSGDTVDEVVDEDVGRAGASIDLDFFGHWG